MAICRLLFHRVRPIFVFDGATPPLKRRTTIARRRCKGIPGSRSHFNLICAVHQFWEVHMLGFANLVAKKIMLQAEGAADRKAAEDSREAPHGTATKACAADE